MNLERYEWQFDRRGEERRKGSDSFCSFCSFCSSGEVSETCGGNLSCGAKKIDQVPKREPPLTPSFLFLLAIQPGSDRIAAAKTTATTSRRSVMSILLERRTVCVDDGWMLCSTRKLLPGPVWSFIAREMEGKRSISFLKRNC